MQRRCVNELQTHYYSTQCIVNGFGVYRSHKTNVILRLNDSPLLLVAIVTIINCLYNSTPYTDARLLAKPHQVYLMLLTLSVRPEVYTMHRVSKKSLNAIISNSYNICVQSQKFLFFVFKRSPYDPLCRQH